MHRKPLLREAYEQVKKDEKNWDGKAARSGSGKESTSGAVKAFLAFFAVVATIGLCRGILDTIGTKINGGNSPLPIATLSTVDSVFTNQITLGQNLFAIEFDVEQINKPLITPEP